MQLYLHPTRAKFISQDCDPFKQTILDLTHGAVCLSYDRTLKQETRPTKVIYILWFTRSHAERCTPEETTGTDEGVE